MHGFARKWTAPLARQLRDQGYLGDQGAGANLEILLLGFDTAILGLSIASNRALHSSGRLRLKLPPEAPSRSTLKLEEAWHTFIPPERWSEILGGGKRAVDLGAGPGWLDLATG